MTKLSYDDGVVRSSVVKTKNGEWLELRRGELTGAALRETGPRRWASKEAWLAAVCPESRDGTTSATPAADASGHQDWAVLGEYTKRGWDVSGKQEMLTELRYLQRRYNESRSERARLYWAEMIQDIAQAGFNYTYKTMWVTEWPELACQLYHLTLSGQAVTLEGGYTAWRAPGFWFHVPYQRCTEAEYPAVNPLPERLDLFAAT